MTRLRIAVLAFLCAALAAACGRKGPPLPPDHFEPVAPPGIAARVVDDRIDLHFTVPEKNTNGTTPAAISRIDIYAKSLAANEPAPLMAKLTTAKYLIGHIDVKPPVDPSAVVTDAPPDPRPAPGEIVAYQDTAPAPDVSVALAPGVRAPQRIFALVGVAPTKRQGPASSVTVTYGTHPPPPTELLDTFDQTTLTLTWTPPPMPVVEAAPVPPVTAAAAAAQAATPVVAAPKPATFRVYAVDHEGHERPNALLTPAPIATPTFAMPVVFGTEACFMVRTVETIGNITIESPASNLKCDTPKDTFPPAAPTNLSAVPDTGTVQLAWRGVDASDLAGYIVLRRATGTATLQRLTPAPISKTTYGDSTAVAGVEYEYVVRAVDTATPPNESADSNTQVVRAKVPTRHEGF